ncbi:MULTISPECIES: helix-turn-helix domain-containing protein [Micromonospora]|nr:MULTISPECIES: helix-turn-helix domain-containing protein [Micromonospora]NES17292.1 helix-turn-helix domain-containing protein [Micromonospora sp. PPF5-17B]NES39664.1 helix-turn-helix domain-containing protein [Micromonospora solifontis]NES59124.1 helix-turn-helix domain-containing protein [Micromonospora sp. PPF5-6]
MGAVRTSVTPERIREAQQALGLQLARCRKAAGKTQAALARRTAYSRSTIANVEVGRQNMPRGFWERVDRELEARGTLMDAFGALHELVAARYAQLSATVEPAPCGCTITVARWSRREILALREALRLSVPAFAERLRIAASVVAGWEDRRHPADPTLAMQAALDDALKLADQDARTRFANILRMPPMTSDDHARASGGGRCATVTPINRSDGSQTAL